jgi:hypothetical protein
MKRIAFFLSTILACSNLANAQEARVNLRGTIVSFKDNVLAVDTQANGAVKVTLAPNHSVRAIVKASLADITVGTFVGCSSTPQADGTRKALEVHIFPESMRGTGEGHSPWDLQPQSAMTNATVKDQTATTVSGVENRTLTLTYKDGEQKIIVPANIPIVKIVPSDNSILIPGAHVFVRATLNAGIYTGTLVNVGKDGVIPPM